jgi:hypothetical protein
LAGLLRSVTVTTVGVVVLSCFGCRSRVCCSYGWGLVIAASCSGLHRLGRVGDGGGIEGGSREVEL